MTSYHYNQNNQNLGIIEQDAQGTWWAISAGDEIRCNSEQEAKRTLAEIYVTESNRQNLPHMIAILESLVS